MRRGTIGLGMVCLAAVMAVAVVPDLRLTREIAAARSEGLWTGASDIRRAIGTVAPGDNAGPLIQAAAKADRKLRIAGAEFNLVAEGKATPAQAATARRALPGLQNTLAAWREASARPRLDYGRRYEDGYRTLFPELAGVKHGAAMLVAAAALDDRPGENLRAAARLSALVRQEPGVIQALVGMNMGKLALRIATEKGMGREIAGLLGPDADVRRVLGPELPGLIDTFSLKDYEGALTDLGVKHSISLGERFSHWGPMAKGSMTTGVSRWRRLWARLPKDGTDLDAAAEVVDREMPAIDALIPSISDVMGKLSTAGGGRGEMLRDLAAFGAERRKAQAPPTPKR